MAGKSAYRMVRASDLEAGQSVKLILTGEPYENEHAKFGKWYKWPVTLLKGQPLHQSQYDTEWAYFAVGSDGSQGTLQAGLMAAYEDPAYQVNEDNRIKVTVTIAKTAAGEKAFNWNVTPHSPNGSGGGSTSKGGSTTGKPKYVETNRIRAAVYVEAVNVLEELIGTEPSHGSALLVAKDIVTHYIMSGANEGELLQGVIGAQRAAEGELSLLDILSKLDVESDSDELVPDSAEAETESEEAEETPW